MNRGDITIEDQRDDCSAGYEFYWSVFVGETNGIKHSICGMESTREAAEIAADKERRRLLRTE